MASKIVLEMFSHFRFENKDFTSRLGSKLWIPNVGLWKLKKEIARKGGWERERERERERGRSSKRERVKDIGMKNETWIIQSYQDAKISSNFTSVEKVCWKKTFTRVELGYSRLGRIERLKGGPLTASTRLTQTFNWILVLNVRLTNQNKWMVALMPLRLRCQSLSFSLLHYLIHRRRFPQRA